MSFKSLLQKLSGLLLTLWGTATVLFFLAQLLPSATSPLGMENPDATVYGGASKVIHQQILNDYKQRRGLTKPLFYFQVQPLGYRVGMQLKQSGNLKAFSQSVVLRHGKEPTKAFLAEWDQLNKGFIEDKTKPSSLNTLRSVLLSWAQNPSTESRKTLEAQFLLILQKTGQKQSEPLARAWHHLTSSTSPFWYFLPTVIWTGTDNQYHSWLIRTVSGNLGTSIKDYRPVLDKVMESLKVSASIGLPGLGMSLIFSSTVGFWLSLPTSLRLKNSIKQALYVLDSLPGFIITLGIFAIYLYLGGSFSSVYVGETTSFTKTTLLGSACVSLFLLPYLTLFFHQSLQQEQNKMYLRTARAKGMSMTRVLALHAVPNALSSSIVVVADVLASLIAGILIVEITFSLPGTGNLLAQSLLSQDFPTVIGLTLFLLIFRTIVMWCADIANAMIDPRMKGV